MWYVGTYTCMNTYTWYIHRYVHTRRKRERERERERKYMHTCIYTMHRKSPCIQKVCLPVPGKKSKSLSVCFS